MAYSPVLPKYIIGFSHCASSGAITHCDEKDCDAVREVIDDFIKIYNNKINIEFIDWEKEHLSETEINSLGEKANAIIMLIEGEISERQVHGYYYHNPTEKEKKDGKSFAKYFIYVKKHKEWTDEDFKKYENEEIHKKIPGIVRYRPFSDHIYLGNYLRKELKNEFENINVLNTAGQDNGGRKYPKWLVWVFVLALISIGIAAALLLYGNRGSSNEPSNPRIIDTTTVVAPKAGIKTPSDSSDRKDSHRRGGTPIPQQNKLVENGFSLNTNGIDDNFITWILAQIGSSSNLKQYQDNKNVRWNIIITEHKKEKGIALNGDYYAELSYTIDITDNETGAKLPPLTPFIKPGIKSAVDYETAFRKARTQSFAETIANGIVKKISNEN